MAVTIKDVAALAGVSPSTVSRTCKNNPSISEETKERVRKAMIELGYEPNFQASNLASQNSRTIGIILPASAKEVYENSFYLEAVQGISHYCNGRQYMTTIVTGQDETEILDAVRSMSRSGKVDGFIVLYSKKEDPVIDYLFNEGLLYILIGIPVPARAPPDRLPWFRQFPDVLCRPQGRLPACTRKPSASCPSGILCGSKECIRE